MAIVKASFTKSRGGAKASIRYIAFRPGKDGEKISRHLFGHDGALSIYQSDRIIDEPEKGTIFFRLVISPDPVLEDREKDLALHELTLQTILNLEDRMKKQVQFIATEHNDHSPNRHVHVIALIPQKLDVADPPPRKAAQFQRRERDLALVYQQGRGAAPPAAGRPNGLPHKPSLSGARGAHTPRQNLAQC